MPPHRNHASSQALSRRALLRTIGVAGMAFATSPAWADRSVELPIAGGPRQRPVTHDFPQKGPMILQRTRRCWRLQWRCSIAAYSRRTTSSMCAGTGLSSRRQWMRTPSGLPCAATSIKCCRCPSAICSRCLAWSLPPSTSARAIPEASLHLVSPGRNGRMARWAMRDGRESCSRMCSTARASSQARSRSASTA